MKDERHLVQQLQSRIKELEFVNDQYYKHEAQSLRDQVAENQSYTLVVNSENDNLK